MLKVKTYKENLRKLEEKYKNNNKDAEYFKERVDLLISDLTPHFPKNIATYINCIAIDLTDGKGIYKYPKEVKEYFHIRGNNGEIGPTTRFDRYLKNESDYITEKKYQENNTCIQDFQYLIEQINELNNEALKQGIIKSKNNSIYGDAIHYFLKKAKENCCEYIERLYVKNKHKYRELEKYCTQHIISIRDISSSYGYKYVIISNDYEYLDDRITLPRIMAGYIGDEFWSIEHKCNITKLEKFSWSYYIYTFELLRSIYIEYIKKYYGDYLEDILNDTFYSFTNIQVFFITHGKTKCYQFDLDELNRELKFEYCKEIFFDEDNKMPYKNKINLIRYFGANFNYLYNSIYENDLFTDEQKRYLKKCIENVLEEISETLYTEGWL